MVNQITSAELTYGLPRRKNKIIVVKGIVSGDWGGLLMVLLDRYKVLDITA
jgi:hypothetical protein